MEEKLYEGNYSEEQLDELKVSYESPNNNHKDLDFETWIAHLENNGLIGDMISTYDANQMLNILNNFDDNDVILIHEAITGENVNGKVKSLKNWVNDISQSFNCKFYL